jgi:hypothetical protein
LQCPVWKFIHQKMTEQNQSCILEQDFANVAEEGFCARHTTSRLEEKINGLEIYVRFKQPTHLQSRSNLAQRIDFLQKVKNQFSQSDKEGAIPLRKRVESLLDETKTMWVSKVTKDISLDSWNNIEQSLLLGQDLAQANLNRVDGNSFSTGCAGVLFSFCAVLFLCLIIGVASQFDVKSNQIAQLQAEVFQLKKATNLININLERPESLISIVASFFFIVHGFDLPVQIWLYLSFFIIPILLASFLIKRLCFAK